MSSCTMCGWPSVVRTERVRPDGHADFCGAEWLFGPPPEPRSPTVVRPTCGTIGGYSSHRHRHEPACALCLAAERAYNQGRRARAR